MITFTSVVQTESFVCSVQHLYISSAQCQNLITSVSMLQLVMIPGSFDVGIYETSYLTRYGHVLLPSNRYSINYSLMKEKNIWHTFLESYLLFQILFRL